MKIDAYTKFLLTVITLCLLYLSLRDLLAVPKVHADEPVRVMLVDDGNTAIKWNGGWAIPVAVQK
jgi:hypothetical protein